MLRALQFMHIDALLLSIIFLSFRLPSCLFLNISLYVVSLFIWIVIPIGDEKRAIGIYVKFLVVC